MMRRPPRSPLFPYPPLFGSTGRALAAAIQKESFDLVLTGSQSDDVGYAGTGSVLAGELGWPHVWLGMGVELEEGEPVKTDRKSTRLNSSHSQNSYAVFCLKK